MRAAAAATEAKRRARDLGDAANKRAARLALVAHNAGQQNRIWRDLHALHVAEALQEVDKWLSIFLSEMTGGTVTLAFVTGRGVHSGDGGPKLLPAVLADLDARCVPYLLTHSGGCVEVLIDETVRAAARTQAAARRAAAAAEAEPPPQWVASIARGRF